MLSLFAQGSPLGARGSLQAEFKCVIFRVSRSAFVSALEADVHEESRKPGRKDVDMEATCESDALLYTSVTETEKGGATAQKPIGPGPAGRERRMKEGDKSIIDCDVRSEVPAELRGGSPGLEVSCMCGHVTPLQMASKTHGLMPTSHRHAEVKVRSHPREPHLKLRSNSSRTSPERRHNNESKGCV
ncbi:hypothetical protein WMY93_022639 [Mugilogobius chulae]|uniref:Uncharacterized protein n=1 Tax=Mugilogobius chulae TaxID=88201 RepID=A0AAW0NHM8_9GOBI